MSTATLLARAALILGVSAVGCQSSTAPPWGLAVVTHGTLFQRESGEQSASVPFTVVNGRETTVYLAACGGHAVPAIERWQDGRWMQYSGGICIASVSMAPVELPAGASHAGHAIISEPGRYRLRMGVAQDRGTTPQWAATASSNAFDVR
jgi:hypothetical protein